MQRTGRGFAHTTIGPRAERMFAPSKAALPAIVALAIITVGVNSSPVPESYDENHQEKGAIDDDFSEDVIDPTNVRTKRQVDYYGSYYYDTNFNNNNCGSGSNRFFNALGLGLSNYLPYYSSRSRNRRLVRNRQPLLYNGRRGLYAPSRYFSSSSSTGSYGTYGSNMYSG
ncbi:uncharacterized protein LOC132192742 [Neocloeon triangulifer]|uniref:uncharacterized protein LOC132192742 n=1 Tax=Neocloeon triangulifer TaxID=2078957 RepID=UPI00286F2E27|nr:uncharacterized protein LOC132192742 [Neocloeon triangulifer]